VVLSTFSLHSIIIALLEEEFCDDEILFSEIDARFFHEPSPWLQNWKLVPVECFNLASEIFGNIWLGQSSKTGSP